MILKIVLLSLLANALNVVADDQLQAVSEKLALLEQQLQHHHQEEHEKGAAVAEPERAEPSKDNNEHRKEEGQVEPSKQTSEQKRDEPLGLVTGGQVGANEPPAQVMQQVRDDNWWSGQQKTEEAVAALAPSKSLVMSKGKGAAMMPWRRDSEPSRVSAIAHSPPFRYFHQQRQPQQEATVYVPLLHQPPVVDLSLHYQPSGAYLGRPAHFRRRAPIVHHQHQPHYLHPAANYYVPQAQRHEHHLAENNQLSYQTGNWLRPEGRLFESAPGERRLVPGHSRTFSKSTMI